MKPDEVVKLTTKYKAYPKATNTSQYVSVDGGVIFKTRSPLTYQKREYAKVIGGKYLFLKPRQYTAEVWNRDALIFRYYRYDKPAHVRNFVYYSATPNPGNKPVWLRNYIAQLKVQANVEFLLKLNDRKVSLMEELKNRRETWSTMASSVIRLGRYYKRMLRDPFEFVKTSRAKAKRKGLRNPTSHRAVKSYGDAWLEGRYHWIPTYLTMLGAFETMLNLGPMGEIYSKTENLVSWTEDLNDETKYLNGSVVKWNHSHLVTFKTGCVVEIDSKVLQITKQYGIDSVPNLAAVAWELTPWSLVVDWVVPITDILLAMGAHHGIKTINGYQVEKHHRYTGSPDSLPYSRIAWSDSIQEMGYEVLQQASIQTHEVYFRYPVDTTELEIRPFIFTPSENQKFLRAIDAISFFSGSKMAKKIISGKI